jgi:hypothetical protein
LKPGQAFAFQQGGKSRKERCRIHHSEELEAAYRRREKRLRQWAARAKRLEGASLE